MCHFSPVAEVKGEDEVDGNENVEKNHDSEGSSSSSSEWQVVDETTEDKQQDVMISREQLERDEEALGRDRDDAMAEEFDEPRK